MTSFVVRPLNEQTQVTWQNMPMPAFPGVFSQQPRRDCPKRMKSDLRKKLFDKLPDEEKIQWYTVFSYTDKLPSGFHNPETAIAIAETMPPRPRGKGVHWSWDDSWLDHLAFVNYGQEENSHERANMVRRLIDSHWKVLAGTCPSEVQENLIAFFSRQNDEEEINRQMSPQDRQCLLPPGVKRPAQRRQRIVLPRPQRGDSEATFGPDEGFESTRDATVEEEEQEETAPRNSSDSQSSEDEDGRKVKCPCKTAYWRFTEKLRERLHAANQDMKWRAFMSEASKQWKDLPAAEKQRYQKEAKAEEDQWKADHPEYTGSRRRRT
jgi:hypothetical protein